MTTYQSLPEPRQSSFARRAGTLAWQERNPVNPTADPVCIYDQDEPIEDRRTKAVVGSVRGTGSQPASGTR